MAPDTVHPVAVQPAGVAGIALHLAVGVFPYAASGLIAPLAGVVVLYGLWFLLLVKGVQQLRKGRGPVVLVMPLLAVVGWVAIMSLGGAVLGWTA